MSQETLGYPESPVVGGTDWCLVKTIAIGRWGSKLVLGSGGHGTMGWPGSFHLGMKFGIDARLLPGALWIRVKVL